MSFVESSNDSANASNNPTTSVIINGCLGRIGKRLCVLISNIPSLKLIGAICRHEHPECGNLLRDVIPEVSRDCNLSIVSFNEIIMYNDLPAVIIDFTSPESTILLLQQIEYDPRLKFRIVIGTTGFSDYQLDEIRRFAQTIPILHAANFSLGMAVLNKIAVEVACALGDDFDIEIVEAHHNQKIDAPSGTAMSLANSICGVTGRTSADLNYGRCGIDKRKKTDIGIHAIRMGSVIGDHTVYYASQQERVELTHKAQDRDVFAYGALRAAMWMAHPTRKAGEVYNIENFLFERK